MPTFIMSCSTIPHSHQRYDTVGDWQAAGGDITIRVSKLSDPRYEKLVALHEVVEALLCKWTGISEESVDEWDRTFTPEGGEPGDDRNCPYHAQHTIASVVERLAADLLGVDWNLYLASLDTLRGE